MTLNKYLERYIMFCAVKHSRKKSRFRKALQKLHFALQGFRRKVMEYSGNLKCAIFGKNKEVRVLNIPDNQIIDLCV